MSHYTRGNGQASSGMTRDGFLQKAHTLDGGRGPLVVKYQANCDRDDRRHEWDEDASREDRFRSGRCHLGHRLLQMSRLWMNVTRTRESSLRTMPWAVSQQTHTRNSAGDAATEKDGHNAAIGGTPSPVEQSKRKPHYYL